MNTLDELLALVQDFNHYIRQEYPDLVLQPVKQQPVPIPKKPFVPPPPPPPAPAPKPTAILPKKEPEPVPVRHTADPIMLTAAKPFVKPMQAPLTDCLEKFKKLGITVLDEPTGGPAARAKTVVFISFYQPGSQEELFIQKVAASVTERLLYCRHYSQPRAKEAALTLSLAASKETQSIFLFYNEQEMPKVREWLAYFGDDVAGSDHILACPIKTIHVTAALMHDPAEKKALWKELQSLA